MDFIISTGKCYIYTKLNVSNTEKFCLVKPHRKDLKKETFKLMVHTDFDHNFMSTVNLRAELSSAYVHYSS